MLKQEFLAKLRSALDGLPQEDIEERLAFYNEMIEDHMEEGAAEEDAVSAVGDISDIVRQVIADVPLPKLAMDKIKGKRRLRGWEITLLALGSPIWLPLGIAALAVMFALYVCLWSLLIALWSVFASLAACALVSIPVFVIFLYSGHVPSAIFVLAGGLVCAGLSIFVLHGCKAATKGTLGLTKHMAVSTKYRILKRREVL